MTVHVLTSYLLACAAVSHTFTTAPTATVDAITTITMSTILKAPSGTSAPLLAFTTTTSGALSTTSSSATAIPTAPPHDPFFRPHHIDMALTTTLQINVFPTPRPSPLPAFRPAYVDFPDGSLLTSMFEEDRRMVSRRNFFIGLLLSTFITTFIRSLSYIKRSERVKNRVLFYILLTSQALGPVCLVSLAVGQYVPSVDCAVVNIIAAVSAQFSYALLITGILGYKAYHVLNRKIIVFAVLALLQSLIFILFAVDLPHMKSRRTLSGGCDVHGTFRFFSVSLVLTFIESSFITGCFLWAMWNSTHRVPQVSYDYDQEMRKDQAGQTVHGRGWWNQAREPCYQTRWSHIKNRVRSMFSPENNATLNRQLDESVGVARNGSFKRMPDPTPVGAPESRTRWSVSTVRTISGGTAKLVQTSRLILKRVIRDELMSNLLVTATIAFSALLGFVGTLKHRVLWGPSLLLDALWVLASLLVMRNFARVIHRRERDNRLMKDRMNQPWHVRSQPNRRHSTMSAMPFADHMRPMNDASDPDMDIEKMMGAMDLEDWRSQADGPASQPMLRRSSSGRSGRGVVPSWVPPRTSVWSTYSTDQPVPPLPSNYRMDPKKRNSTSSLGDVFQDPPSPRSPHSISRSSSLSDPFQYDEMRSGDWTRASAAGVASPASVYSRKPST